MTVVMIVTVVVPVCVIMAMIVPAAAARAMRVPVVMIVVIMTMMIMTTMIVIMPVIVIGAALRLEGARHGLHRAAKAADHFGEHVILLEIEGIGGDFAGRMAVADMPGGLEEPHWIVGLDFDQRLRRGLDENKRAIFEFHRVAVIERGRLFEIEQEDEPLLAGERDPATVAPFMVEADHIDDFVGLDGGLADDRTGALHQIIPFD